MNVLLSINPQHVRNIFDGSKKFEFRRRLHARHDVRRVSIYCTAPVKRLVGEFDIASILCEKPEDLWAITYKRSGISKEFFDRYFEGRHKAYALEIGEVIEYEDYIDPCTVFKKFTPPQSFMYIEKSCRQEPRQRILDLG